MLRLRTFLLAFSVLLCFVPAFAQDFNPERDIAVSFKNGTVVIDVPAIAHVTELEVMLKRGSPGKLSATLPPPKGKDSLGAEYWAGTIRIPLKGEGLKEPVAILVSYMCCLEGEGGLCFPPVDRELKVKVSDIPGGASVVDAGIETKTQAVTPIPIDTGVVSQGNVSNLADTGADTVDARQYQADSPSSTRSFGYLLKILILFFLGGIGASLTPCVLPMIPVTMAIIGARSASKAKGLLLGVVLTQGMALTYTVLGVIAALTGSVFGRFAQHPGFLIPVSLIFALFAISLFGAFEIKLPDSLTNRLQTSGPRSGFLGAFVMGLILGPISAPCVGPLIGAAIMDIGINRLVFEGALKMFVFAQGMGLLFIIGGVAISALPKSGDWLIRFKQALGIAILAFAVWNIRLIVPEWANYSMWALVMLLAAGVFGAFEAAAGLVGTIRKGFALFAFAVAILLGIRGTELFLDIQLLPRGGVALTESPSDPHALWIEHDFEEALDKAKTQNKLVLVDTFTSWCIQCKELDEKTWPNPYVVDWIQDNAVAVRIDTEKFRPDLAKSLGVTSYPTIILMTSEGKEIRRLNGFHKPEKMLGWLRGE